MEFLIIVIIIVILLGGGNFYAGRSNYYSPGISNIVWVLLVLFIIFILFGHSYFGHGRW
jgi:hypothetical protein